MCELLGISCNQPAAWGDTLTSFRKRGGETADNPDGWGLAWREAGAWQLHKAPEAAIHSGRFAALSQTIVTDLLIAHVRKANPPGAFTMENTYPFVRECCGRSWIFAHNGKVPEVTQPQGCCHPHKSRPQGETDSEHAFYFLLDEITSMFSDTVTESSAIWLQKLAKLSEDIASYGQFNFLMSDGDILIAYGHDRLHRLQCQHDDIKTTLLASEPLSDDESWEIFQTGELQVYREGKLIGSLETEPVLTHPSDKVNEGGRERTI
ncbi:MAG: class II glutamine amidotransferase [Gammaproteobacteria bacterium]|nr:MAG: class II glutamine amidotransferase [Gammaproteobacteria bacterium]